MRPKEETLFVHMGDDTKHEITHVDNVSIKSLNGRNQRLDDVMYVLGISRNLVFIG